MSSFAPPLDLFLFTTDLQAAKAAEAAGVKSLIVDWERHGKQARQHGYDTEINAHTEDDVRVLADALAIPITVRVDSLAGDGERDIEVALDAGAKILMLPMAEKVSDVERFLALVRGRARTLIQIETDSLVREAADLRSLGWDYAYVGLNDLMISRRGTWLWTPLLDGTLDRLYDNLGDRPLGFGGVTIVGGGAPIPFTLLLHEMTRLGCRLSFMRRTFWREIEGRNLSAELDAVRALWQASHRRSESAIAQDHRALRQLLNAHAPQPKKARPTLMPKSV